MPHSVASDLTSRAPTSTATSTPAATAASMATTGPAGGSQTRPVTRFPMSHATMNATRPAPTPVARADTTSAVVARVVDRLGSLTGERLEEGGEGAERSEQPEDHGDGEDRAQVRVGAPPHEVQDRPCHEPHDDGDGGLPGEWADALAPLPLHQPVLEVLRRLRQCGQESQGED